jgi:hypothetical protein
MPVEISVEKLLKSCGKAPERERAERESGGRQSPQSVADRRFSSRNALTGYWRRGDGAGFRRGRAGPHPEPGAAPPQNQHHSEIFIFKFPTFFFRRILTKLLACDKI